VKGLQTFSFSFLGVRRSRHRSRWCL